MGQRGLDAVHAAARVGLCADCARTDCTFRAMRPDRRSMRHLSLSRGQRLECARSGCMRFWVLISGTAATCTAFRDGRRQIHSIEHGGAVLCGPMARQSTEQWVEALSDTVICEIDLSARAAELRRDPDFMARVFGLLHARLAQSQAHLSTLGRLDSHERVTLFLAEMAAQAGGEDAVVTLPMSREDIADYLGLNAETVSRILTRIRKSGLVRFLTPTEFLVPDMEAVARRIPIDIPGLVPAERKALP